MTKKKIISEQNLSSCEEVFSNTNDKLDSTRFNIVFIGAGFSDVNDLKMAAGRVIDLNGVANQQVKSEGLMQIPIFKSNKDRFNFWYINKTMEFPNDSPESVWNTLYQDDWVKNCQSILPNRVIPIFIYPGKRNMVNCEKHLNSSNCLIYGRDEWCLWNSTDCVGKGYPYASMGRSYVTLIDCIDSNSNCEANPYPGLQNANVHELLHTIPCLGDEYGGFDNTPFNISLDSNGKLQFYKGDSYSDCIANAPWEDYIGNGCGIDGIIDCFDRNIGQPLRFDNRLDYRIESCIAGKDCTSEIGCFEGGNYFQKGIWRSSTNTIMRVHWAENLIKGSSYLNDWDQRIVSRVIQKGPTFGKNWKSGVDYQLDCDSTTSKFASD